MKIGDRVRVISDENKTGHGIPVGTELIVSKLGYRRLLVLYERYMRVVDMDEVEVISSDTTAIDAVVAERQRQDAKWGEQNHEPALWLGILTEEVGELAQAINETVFDNGDDARTKGGYDNMRAEAVQVAAVAVQFIEYLDRVNGGRTT